MLFDIVPENFFSPLASPGRLVYWECIVRIYAITRGQLSFGVERDVLVDDLEYYFTSLMSADIPEETGTIDSGGLSPRDKTGTIDSGGLSPRDKTGTIDSGGLSPRDKTGTIDSGGLSPRDKANFILRRLEGWGWIYTDVDYSYIQRVSFRDYAITIIRSLLDVSEEKKTEYQGYIYTIFSLARSTESPGIALLQIVENTDALITGLKSLNANIKKYIDDLTRHSTVAEILDALLNDYYTNIVDRAYHRLLTSDNVSKFRPEIISRLDADSRDEAYLLRAAREIAELQNCSENEAREKTLTYLHSIIDAFRQMDAILSDINQKNTRYQRSAINRARFLLTSSDDLRGMLKDILSHLADVTNESGGDFASIYEYEIVDELIRMFSFDYLDTDSLYAPMQGQKEFIPQELSQAKPDPQTRARQRRKVEERLARALTPAKIDAYVLALLGENESILASSLPLSVGDTFIRLIYIRLYGQRKNMSYTIELLDRVEAEGFHFRDYRIKRKK